MRARRLTSAIVGLGLFAASCGGQSTDSAADSPPATIAPQPISDAPTTESTPTAVAADDAAVEVVQADPSVAEAPVDTEVPEPDPAVVPALLQFTAPLVGGGELDAATLADKPTLFWFWAPT